MRFRQIVLTLSLLAIPSSLLAKDIPAGAWAGTWNFNVAKCSFPGPPPKVDQVVIQPDGTVTVNEESPEGKKTTWSYKPQAGKYVPVQGRENVTVLMRKVNSHRTEQTWNIKGKVQTSFAILSKDGKTQTFSMGKETVVYEKQ